MLWDKKAASTTPTHPSSRIERIEDLMLFEKRNLLICEKELKRQNQFLECFGSEKAEGELPAVKRQKMREPVMPAVNQLVVVNMERPVGLLSQISCDFLGEKFIIRRYIVIIGDA